MPSSTFIHLNGMQKNQLSIGLLDLWTTGFLLFTALLILWINKCCSQVRYVLHIKS